MAGNIRFNDGAGYERMMGVWSRLVGEIFLDWVSPSKDLRWIDVGCGNGAFTELIIDRYAPAEVRGVDPSEGQIAFARARPAAQHAQFEIGDAMALPFPAARFDAAIMALVIFFVPKPERGVAEMARVLQPGGLACAYAWDMPGGGFPLEPIFEELRAMGIQPGVTPQPDASRLDSLKKLWADAGLTQIATREITVTRTFSNFDEFWSISQLGASVGATVAAMSVDQVAVMKEKLRLRLPPDREGRIVCSARANAIKGRKPA